MSKFYHRREFIKLSTAAFAGASATLSGILNLGTGTGSDSNITVWGTPGGDVLESPDYKVTLRSRGINRELFTYYSYNKPVDKIIDQEGKYIKLAFLNLHSVEYKRPEANRDTYAHSWGYFDFAGGPVEVEVKILKAFDGLTLPLKSCGIFPSPLGIKCQIIGNDVIRFTMDKPAKIAVVPNYRQALEELKNTEPKQAFEGYRNPLFLFARSPEINVPPKNSPGTLVIKPGQAYGVYDFAKATTIYFEAGVHDYSHYNPNDPGHYISLNKGQTVYLAGGAYVYGIFRSDIQGPISNMPVLRGRGTFSGFRHPWSGNPEGNPAEKNVCMEGINIVDVHNYISHSISTVKDVAVIGAWHGNTDGFTRMVRKDPYDGWHLDDCFVMAADSNLKLVGTGRVRNYTIWQLSNSEPLWIWDTDGCIVDGLNVIAYNKWEGGGQVFNYPAGGRGRGNKDLVIRNVTIEAPYIPLLFLMSSTYTGAGPAYQNVLFENIIVNTPYIHSKSPLGQVNETSSDFGKVVFRNLVINGTKVIDENCKDYFELLNRVTIGKEIVFE